MFEGRTDNRTVYKTVASPIVQSALDGINGTIFACALSLGRAAGCCCRWLLPAAAAAGCWLSPLLLLSPAAVSGSWRCGAAGVHACRMPTRLPACL